MCNVLQILRIIFLCRKRSFSGAVQSGHRLVNLIFQQGKFIFFSLQDASLSAYIHILKINRQLLKPLTSSPFPCKTDCQKKGSLNHQAHRHSCHKVSSIRYPKLLIVLIQAGFPSFSRRRFMVTVRVLSLT